MVIALFGDVHGNLPALELFLYKTKFVDNYISLGDVVNYGPWSNECVQLVDTLPTIVKIRGNHEDYFLVKKYSGNNEVAKAFFDHCILDFKQDDLISNYVKEFSFQKYRLIHTVENKIVFQDTELQIRANTIIGHSHQQYDIKRNGLRLINPGSVGQNRAYINEINYMLWHTEEDLFESCKLVYDVDLVIREMEARHYPSICVNYYKNKKRA